MWNYMSNNEKKHALAAYKWAWADGEPYVHRYNLNKIRTECKDKNVQFLRGLGGFVWGKHPYPLSNFWLGKYAIFFYNFC
jgi:hypothetical protein